MSSGSSIDWTEVANRIMRIDNPTGFMLDRLFCLICYKSTLTRECQHCGSLQTRRLRNLMKLKLCKTGLMRWTTNL